MIDKIKKSIDKKWKSHLTAPYCTQTLLLDFLLIMYMKCGVVQINQ